MNVQWETRIFWADSYFGAILRFFSPEGHFVKVCRFCFSLYFPCISYVINKFDVVPHQWFWHPKSWFRYEVDGLCLVNSSFPVNPKCTVQFVLLGSILSSSRHSPPPSSHDVTSGFDNALSATHAISYVSSTVTFPY